jgi:hypothetical protein
MIFQFASLFAMTTHLGGRELGRRSRPNSLLIPTNLISHCEWKQSAPFSFADVFLIVLFNP